MVYATKSAERAATAPDQPAEPEHGGVAGLSVALERLASWVRRNTPRGEFNLASMATLDALVAEGPMRVCGLAARERVSQPGMTGLVTRLAEAGLVERRADPDDGRAALVVPTAAARAHLATRHAARAAVLAEHIGRLPAEQRRALLAAAEGLNALTSPVPADAADAAAGTATDATDPKGKPA